MLLLTNSCQLCSWFRFESRSGIRPLGRLPWVRGCCHAAAVEVWLCSAWSELRAQSPAGEGCCAPKGRKRSVISGGSGGPVCSGGWRHDSLWRTEPQGKIKIYSLCHLFGILSPLKGTSHDHGVKQSGVFMSLTWNRTTDLSSTAAPMVQVTETSPCAPSTGHFTGHPAFVSTSCCHARPAAKMILWKIASKSHCHTDHKLQPLLSLTWSLLASSSSALAVIFKCSPGAALFLLPL